MPKIDGLIYDGHFFDAEPLHKMFDTPPIKKNENRVKFLVRKTSIYVKVNPKDIIKYALK